MLLLSMNSKRKRRPNVRLGEIGEVACGSLQRPSERFEEKRWKTELGNYRKVDFHSTSAFSLLEPEFTVSDSLGTQNRENWNPNTFKPILDVAGSNETNASKARLDFGAVKRKVRLMKRRGRSVRNYDAISNIWHYSVASGNSNGNGGHTEDGNGESVMPSSTYELNGFKNCLEDETPDVRRRACKGYSNEYLPGNDGKASNGLSSDERGCLVYKAGEVSKRRTCDTIANGIKGWLDELGFRKYSGIFERHEVDEEALPLLTFEDLREMGINTVGARRKMYTAIQLLKEGISAGRVSTLND